MREVQSKCEETLDLFFSDPRDLGNLTIPPRVSYRAFVESKEKTMMMAMIRTRKHPCVKSRLKK